MICHTQLSKYEIIGIDVFKCVKRQVQCTLSEIQVIVNTRFHGTISPRVCQNDSSNRESADALDEHQRSEDEHGGDEDAEDEGDEGEHESGRDEHEGDEDAEDGRRRRRRRCRRSTQGGRCRKQIINSVVGFPFARK